ncbi:AfsR/SARP family transcriptional regulator [Acrocarpospora corrugata]|nr:BTAD domain-containing putative transcriptional regulator [Acrocarpospora corrugata]
MLTIRLLGPPAIERDGLPVRPPRGHKTWALLGYLLLADRPPSRRRLAGLLFGDAEDPLGALRWSLAEPRRAVGVPGLLTGDPVVVRYGDDVNVDLPLLIGDLADPAPLLEFGGELLEGVDVTTSPEFESWLLVERHRIAATVAARLRRAATALLAGGRAREALAYAGRAVAGDPLEEANHALLVRILAVLGDRAGALRQVAICQETLRRELGIEASTALWEAAPPRRPARDGVRGSWPDRRHRGTGWVRARPMSPSRSASAPSRPRGGCSCRRHHPCGSIGM